MREDDEPLDPLELCGYDTPEAMWVAMRLTPMPKPLTDDLRGWLGVCGEDNYPDEVLFAGVLCYLFLYCCVPEVHVNDASQLLLASGISFRGSIDEACSTATFCGWVRPSDTLGCYRLTHYGYEEVMAGNCEKMAEFALAQAGHAEGTVAKH